MQLRDGTELQNIRLKTDIGTLCDRTVSWLVGVFNHINKPEIVKKAFEKCEIGTFNLSFESITSAAALQELRNVQLNEPERWEKINLWPTPQEELNGDFSNEDSENELLDDADDSALPMAALQDTSDRGDPNVLADAEDGGLTLGSAAQDLLDDEAFDWSAADDNNRVKTRGEESRAGLVSGSSGDGGAELGRGKQKRAAPQRYNDFYLH